MREIRQSGSEGGVAVTRHPYPYDGSHLWCWGGRFFRDQSRRGRQAVVARTFGAGEGGRTASGRRWTPVGMGRWGRGTGYPQMAQMAQMAADGGRRGRMGVDRFAAPGVSAVTFFKRQKK